MTLDMIRLADAVLCDKRGISGTTLEILKRIFDKDPVVSEVLGDVKVISWKGGPSFGFPEDHPGIENIIREGA